MLQTPLSSSSATSQRDSCPLLRGFVWSGVPGNITNCMTWGGSAISSHSQVWRLGDMESSGSSFRIPSTSVFPIFHHYNDTVIISLVQNALCPRLPVLLGRALEVILLDGRMLALYGPCYVLPSLVQIPKRSIQVGSHCGFASVILSFKVSTKLKGDMKNHCFKCAFLSLIVLLNICPYVF